MTNNMKSYFLILLTTLVIINRVNPYKQTPNQSLKNLGTHNSSQVVTPAM